MEELHEYAAQFRNITDSELESKIPEKIQPYVCEFIRRLCIEDEEVGGLLELKDMKNEIESLRIELLEAQANCREEELYEENRELKAQVEHLQMRRPSGWMS